MKENQVRLIVEAMQKTLDSGFVEPIPLEEIIPSDTKQCWYMPVLPVHLVYDSSTTSKSVSLNRQLLQVPDWNNCLQSVLPRFWNRKIGFSADIQSMFYVFHLPDEDKDFTRIFWWKNTDPKEDLVDIGSYRASVHIFGNTSSSSLATLGLLWVWVFAFNFGSSLSLGLRWVWVFAESGSSLSLGLRWVWVFAEFGSSLSLGLRFQLWVFAESGSSLSLGLRYQP